MYAPYLYVLWSDMQLELFDAQTAAQGARVETVGTEAAVPQPHIRVWRHLAKVPDEVDGTRRGVVGDPHHLLTNRVRLSCCVNIRDIYVGA